MITYSRHLTSILTGCKKLADYWEKDNKYRKYDFNGRYDMNSPLAKLLFGQIYDICRERQGLRPSTEAFEYLYSPVQWHINTEYVVPYSHRVPYSTGLCLSWGELIGLIMYSLEIEPAGGAALQALCVVTPVPVFVVHLISQMRVPMVRHFYGDELMSYDESWAGPVFHIMKHVKEERTTVLSCGMDALFKYIEQDAGMLRQSGLRRFSHFIDDYQLWFDEDYGEVDQSIEEDVESLKKCRLLQELGIKHEVIPARNGYESLSNCVWGNSEMEEFLRRAISSSVNKSSRVRIEGFGELEFKPKTYLDTRKMTRDGFMRMTPAHCYYFINRVYENTVLVIATPCDYRVMARHDAQVNESTRVICLYHTSGVNWHSVKLSRRGEKELKLFLMEEYELTDSLGTDFFYEAKKPAQKSTSGPSIDPHKYVPKKLQPLFWLCVIRSTIRKMFYFKSTN